MRTDDRQNTARWRILVDGLVQGVGFRPAVQRLALARGIRGFVRNLGGAVEIEAQGSSEILHDFLGQLTELSLPTARTARISTERIASRPEAGFVIGESAAGSSAEVTVAPDVGICAECLDDLGNPASRWHQHPFASCSACGPRFTIAMAVPFDRQRTTMSAFPLCPACRADYGDLGNRRMHAQTIACRNCGPKLSLRDPAGTFFDVADPLAQAAEWLGAGRIGAVKGVGGFHLCCDATNPEAVDELRRRKRRDAKPLAIMVANLAEAARWCEVTREEASWLSSSARPIVLLRERFRSGLAGAVSAGLQHAGVMLPYTALHHLLLSGMNDRPLVMTSGNASDEPTLFRDEEIAAQLGGIADFVLTHDRTIASRCDDSVVRLMDAQPIFIRRSRGYAPAPLALPRRLTRPVLAVGGQLKAAFALGETDRAIVSHHLGDLDSYASRVGYESAIDHYERLFRVRPEVLVHDLHPDYASTHYAVERAARDGLRLMAVQHHHAHFASCLAEHRHDKSAIGVCFDGTGYGTDGAIWGGEFLIGDARRFERAAHLRYTAMPGGEKAVREPWRMAAAFLSDAGLRVGEWLPAFPEKQLATLARMMERRFNAPPTSSVGRFCDAMAALLGLRTVVAYEGQAAMELEALAHTSSADGAYDFALGGSRPAIVDLRPVVREVVDELRRGTDRARIARRIHHTLASIVESVCRHLADRGGPTTVALSGGVFMNAILLAETTRRLAQAGFRVLQHTALPPNDGGISFGQLAVVAAQNE